MCHLHTAADQGRRMIQSGQLETCILKKEQVQKQNPEERLPMVQWEVGNLAEPMHTNWLQKDRYEQNQASAVSVMPKKSVEKNIKIYGVYAALRSKDTSNVEEPWLLELYIFMMMIIVVNLHRVVESRTPSGSPQPSTTPGQILPGPPPAVRSTSNEKNWQGASSHFLVWYCCGCQHGVGGHACAGVLRSSRRTWPKSEWRCLAITSRPLESLVWRWTSTFVTKSCHWMRRMRCWHVMYIFMCKKQGGLSGVMFAVGWLKRVKVGTRGNVIMETVE